MVFLKLSGQASDKLYTCAHGNIRKHKLKFTKLFTICT